MFAQFYYEPGILRGIKTPTPHASAGEAVVRVQVTLTCGTDLKIYRRGHTLVNPPQILGHEFTGTIAKVGSGVKRFKEGDRVVAVNSAPCRHCFYCRHGQPNLCATINEKLLGFSLPGAYAEYVKIPSHILAQNTYPLPEDTAAEQMAMLEPLSCAMHGSDASGMQEGDIVAVIGGGPMGLMHVALAKAKNAGRVICVDHHDSRLEVARQLGADLTVAATGVGAVEAVREMTEGRGADIVIEATGHMEGWSRGFEMVRKGGTVLFFGGCPTGTVIPFGTGKIHYGDLTLKGSFHHTPKSVKRAYELLARGKLKLAPLISRRLPMSDAEQALQMMAKGEALKVALIP